MLYPQHKNIESLFLTIDKQFGLCYINTYDNPQNVVAVFLYRTDKSDIAIFVNKTTGAFVVADIENNGSEGNTEYTVTTTITYSVLTQTNVFLSDPIYNLFYIEKELVHSGKTVDI